MASLKSIERKDFIVRIAKQHFATLGYDAATLRDIAIDANTTASSLAYYFTSKTLLLDMALREGLGNFSNRIMQISCSRRSASDRLAKMTETYFAFLRDEDDLQTILDREADQLAGRPPFDYLATAKADIDEAWRDVLAEVLADDPSLQSNTRARTARRIIDGLGIVTALDDVDCDQRTRIYLRNKLAEQIASALTN